MEKCFKEANLISIQLNSLSLLFDINVKSIFNMITKNSKIQNELPLKKETV